MSDYDIKSEREQHKSHNLHFLTGVFALRFMLTPIVGKYRCWKFNGGNYTIEYQDIYVFGIRIIRWQL